MDLIERVAAAMYRAPDPDDPDATVCVWPPSHPKLMLRGGFVTRPKQQSTQSRSRIMDDAIFRALVDGNRLNLACRIGLSDMWDDVAQTLGRRVTFMTSEQREAVR